MGRALLLLFVLLFAPLFAAGVEVDAWIVSDGKGYTHVSGSVDDFKTIAKLRERLQGEFVYARVGREGWLISDDATVTVLKAICREPADLEARRREVERSMRELEREMRKIERQLDRVEELMDEGRADEAIEAEERKLEALERALERREAEIEEVEHDVESAYDAWHEEVEREMGRVLGDAIESGRATRVQR